MAKIETVAQRQRGGHDFDSYYRNQCALQNLCPTPQVLAHINENFLSFNGDRIR